MATSSDGWKTLSVIENPKRDELFKWDPKMTPGNPGGSQNGTLVETRRGKCNRASKESKRAPPDTKIAL
jgi:hypothetical protein